MGGFKLAYYLMTEDLFDHSKILYKVTEPVCGHGMGNKSKT